jgi:hypothetical protein
MNWASVYETLLLSSLNNPDSVMIIKMADNDELMQADSANNFYGPWKKEEMPVEYFNLNKK